MKKLAKVKSLNNVNHGKISDDKNKIVASNIVSIVDIFQPIQYVITWNISTFLELSNIDFLEGVM